MSTMRRRFLVSWDDREPVEVRTNAWDLTRAADRANIASDPVMSTFALIHAALERTGQDPGPFEQWLEVVDDVAALDGHVEDAIMGPTSEGPSDGEP